MKNINRIILLLMVVTSFIMVSFKVPYENIKFKTNTSISKIIVEDLVVPLAHTFVIKENNGLTDDFKIFTQTVNWSNPLIIGQNSWIFVYICFGTITRLLKGIDHHVNSFVK